MSAAEPVFLDTACLIALVRRRDALHHAAAEVMNRLRAERCPLVTTEWVLAEFLGSTSDPTLRRPGVALTRRLMMAGGATIIDASHSDFVRALDLYASRDDKGWSLVDCSSILLCQSRGIRRVFTHDRHFA